MWPLPRAEPSRPTPSVRFPVASDVRLAGDGKQTRFVLDLDQTIPVHAFTLADPYRVVLDSRRSAFSFRPELARRGAA